MRRASFRLGRLILLAAVIGFLMFCWQINQQYEDQRKAQSDQSLVATPQLGKPSLDSVHQGTMFQWRAGSGLRGEVITKNDTNTFVRWENSPAIINYSNNELEKLLSS